MIQAKSLLLSGLFLLSIPNIIYTATVCPATEVKIPFITPSTKDPIEQLMLKWSPVAYLASDEPYMPLSFEEYISHPQTTLNFWPNHKNENVIQGAREIIKKGPLQVSDLWCLGNYPLPNGMTNEQAQDLCNKSGLAPRFIHHYHGPDTNALYLEAPECLNKGSNPDTTYINRFDPTISYKAKTNGVIKTPLYVYYSETENGLAYLQYWFFYGYNGTYSIHIPYAGLLSYISLYEAGAHPADAEHITLEFYKNDQNYTLKRVFFSAHGSGESKWRNATDPDLEFERLVGEDNNKPATHPVVLLAKNGHGCYPPPAGTWLRLCGEANDVTSKGQRWEPLIVRLEKPTSPTFNPSTMGMAAYMGDFGNDGVSSFITKKAGYPEHEDPGISKEDSQRIFCEDKGTLYNVFCTNAYRINSCYIPTNYQAVIPNGHVFDNNLLPPPFIKVHKDSELIFRKKSEGALSYNQKNDAPVETQELQVKTLNITCVPASSATIQDNGDEWVIKFDKKVLMTLVFTEEAGPLLDGLSEEEKIKTEQEHLNTTTTSVKVEVAVV